MPLTNKFSIKIRGEERKGCDASYIKKLKPLSAHEQLTMDLAIFSDVPVNNSLNTNFFY